MLNLLKRTELTLVSITTLCQFRPLSTTLSASLRIRLDDQGNSASVPDKPQPVDADLCCMSGCARCVWDVYAEEMQAYEEGLRKLQKQLADDHQPEPRLLTRLIREIDSGALSSDVGGPDASMRAFIQMEQKLKQNTS
ncbi:oxidoreductase-like protein [Syncephalis fuscata]|nr:oxidoreductase-like protein [Syncephalis fuscata]